MNPEGNATNFKIFKIIRKLIYISLIIFGLTIIILTIFINNLTVSGKSVDSSSSTYTSTNILSNSSLPHPIISTAPSTIYEDDSLAEFGISLDHSNALGAIPSKFHIFSKSTTLSADTNGNIATASFHGPTDFGTRNYNSDLFYLKNINSSILPNAFRANKSKVIVCSLTDVLNNNNNVSINNVHMENILSKHVNQDDVGNEHIDIDYEFQQLIQRSNTYVSKTDNSDVIYNFDDINKRTIDVSKIVESNESVAYISIPFSYLTDPQSIYIRGLAEANNPTIIINVTDIPKNGEHWLQTKIELFYGEYSSSLPNAERTDFSLSNVLFNFGNTASTLNFSGRFMGSILAPSSVINAHANIDGNIIANTVNVVGGETHKWDLQSPIDNDWDDDPDPVPTPEPDPILEPEPVPIPEPDLDLNLNPNINLDNVFNITSEELTKSIKNPLSSLYKLPTKNSNEKTINRNHTSDSELLPKTDEKIFYLSLWIILLPITLLLIIYIIYRKIKLKKKQ